MKISKKNLSIMILIVILLSLISFIYYQWKFDDIVESPKPTMFIKLTENTPYELKDNDNIQQIIYPQVDTIKNLSIKFATYQKNNYGNIKLVVKDKEGEVYIDELIDISKLNDNDYFSVNFDKPAENIKGQKLFINLSVDYMSDSDKICVYIGKNGMHNVNVNGEELQGKSIDLYSYDGIYYNLKIAYILITIFIIISVLFLYYLAYLRKVKFEKLAAVTISCVGIVYMCLFTPYSVPDEGSHIDTTYQYSNLLTLNKFSTDNGKLQIRKDDYLIRLDDAYNTKINKYTYSFCIDNMFETTQSNDNIEINSVFVSSPFWMYLPQSMGMAFARILNLGYIPMLYFGRLSNLLVFTMISYVAMKRTPILKYAIACIALFPMTMQLVSSFSSDATVIGVSFLFISECLYLKNKDTYINKYDVIRLCIYSALLAPCKSIAYYPICFLCLIIPSKQFENNKKRNLFYTCVLISGFLSFLIISLQKFIYVIGSQNPNTSYYSISFIFEHPLQFFNIVLNTIRVLSDFYFLNIFGNQLGWFNVSIEKWITALFVVLFVLCSIKCINETYKISKLNKLWIFILCIGVICAVEIAMFVGWTNEGNEIIVGVQGRYFIPIMFLISLLIRNSDIVINKPIGKNFIFFALSLHLMTFISIANNI